MNKFKIMAELNRLVRLREKEKNKKSDTEKHVSDTPEQANNNSSNNKEQKNQKIVAIIKKTVKTLIKATAITTLTVTGLVASYYGSGYICAKTSGALDFKEQKYVQNVNIKQGYYNEKPLIFCISNNFSQQRLRKVISAIEDFDKKAEGLTFIWKMDDGSKNYDIYVDEKDLSNFSNSYISNGNNVIELASQNNAQSAERLNGWIYVSKNASLAVVFTAIQHGICHVIGIDHSKNPTSLMFPTLTSLRLTKFDINNINAIYPANQEQQNINERKAYNSSNDYEME